MIRKWLAGGFCLGLMTIALPAWAEGGGSVLTLPQVIERAEAHNLDLVVLREKRVQASGQLRKAWAAILPQLSAAGSYTRNSDEAVLGFPDFSAGFDVANLPDGGIAVIPRAVVETTLQPYNQWGAVAQATLPLLVMPAYYGIGAASSAVDLTEASVRYAKDELLFGVAQAYYGAVTTQRLVELAKKQLEAATEQERVAKVRFEAGDLFKVAYLRAGVDRAKAEQDLRRAENALVTVKLALTTLAGLEGDFSVETPAAVQAPTDAEQALVDKAMSTRNDLVASAKAVELAERAVKATWWSFAPVLSANGQYRWTNVKGFTGEETSWLVQVTAAISLFDGGARYGDLEINESKAREARAALENARRRIVQEVKSSMVDVHSAQANLVKAREQARLAQENAALVKTQFDAGAATYLDVTDANTALYGAELGAVTEELNLALAALRLSKSVGALGLSKS